MHNFDAICRSAVFRNIDSNLTKNEKDPKLKLTGKVIERAHSITVDFEASQEPNCLVKVR